MLSQPPFLAVVFGLLDIDGQTTPLDHPEITDGFGQFDIGADEYHPSDVIFRSAFESN